MKKTVLLFLFCLTLLMPVSAQDSVLHMPSDTLPVQTDTLQHSHVTIPKNLFDSLSHPEMMRSYFFMQERIRGMASKAVSGESARDLPRLKAIKLRKTEEGQWKFWVLISTILFLALVRLLNVKRFDEIMVSAFDLHADFKSYSDKTGNYFMSNLGLFVNFIFSMSLFLTTLFEINHQVETDNYYLLFWKLSFLLFLVYLLKVILNLIIGSVFKLRSVAVVTLFNAIMVNNVLGVVLVFFNLFFVFVPDQEITRILSALILITMLVTVIFRQIKNLIMTPQSGKVQFIYLFIYLCSLEILPWLVLFKLFLNSW